MYKSKNNITKETVAIKLLNNLPKHRKYSERELEIIDKKLDHENTVSITEYFSIHARIYIVMEYCRGGDLQDYIIKNEPKLNERFNLMTDMARGVLYLHCQNIVHRDLKPENVLLTNTGQRYICKITDFGLSRIMKQKEEEFSTHCGSPPFMAPEVIEGYSHSKPVDVFSLGLIYFAVYRLSMVQNSYGERLLVPAKIQSKKNYDFVNFVLRKEQPTVFQFVLDFFRTSEEMGRFVYSMVRRKPEERPLMDQVLIGIVEEKVRHDFIGGQEESKERDLFKMGTWKEHQDKIRDLEAKINDQEAKINSQEHQMNNQEAIINNKEDLIRDQEDTISHQRNIIEDILQQNAKLQEELNKYSENKKPKGIPKKETKEQEDLKEPSVSKQDECLAKPTVRLKRA